MTSSISEDKIIKGYRAALQYGPEHFNHEQRAHHAMTSEMFDFLVDMESADVFDRKAYHAAGRLGVDICCVDWMQDVAEETDDFEEFIDSLIEGFDTPDTTGYYVCRTPEGERVDHVETEQEAIERAGELQAVTGFPHHYYDSHDEEVTLDV